MEQLDQRPPPLARAPRRRRVWAACSAAGLSALGCGALIVVLRVVNDDAEPRQNWWLVAWFVVGLAYS